MSKTTRVVLFVLILIVTAARLCHSDILWVEEAYPTAAAAEIASGKVLYKDVWFDKPPLYALIYLLWGARTGVALRLAGSVYVLLACWIAFRFAKELWGEREAVYSACLLGFFLTFGIPSAVMALAPDLLMVTPHLAAVYLAWRGRAFWSGVLAGVALLTNSKGVLVLAACALWQYRAIPQLIAGFAVPNLIAIAALYSQGALEAYWQQVWWWGWIYSRSTFLAHPYIEGLKRTANWAGFQIALIIPAAWYIVKAKEPVRRKVAGWLLISLVGVAAGWRFFPRYYFQLLPVMVLAASRGLVLMPKRWSMAALLLLLIPALRFGPRYVTLAEETLHGRAHQWADLALNQQSRAAAEMIRAKSQPSDTLLVWGYRPDVFVYSGLRAGTRYLDSQPLTGVLADRHLTDSTPSASELAASNRAELISTRPTFIADGLGPSNPRLAIANYPDLRAWLANYDRFADTDGFVLYRLSAGPDRRAFGQKR
jgi:hypothetical protein